MLAIDPNVLSRTSELASLITPENAWRMVRSKANFELILELPSAVAPASTTPGIDEDDGRVSPHAFVRPCDCCRPRDRFPAVGSPVGVCPVSFRVLVGLRLFGYYPWHYLRRTRTGRRDGRCQFDGATPTRGRRPRPMDIINLSSEPLGKLHSCISRTEAERCCFPSRRLPRKNPLPTGTAALTRNAGGASRFPISVAA